MFGMEIDDSKSENRANATARKILNENYWKKKNDEGFNLHIFSSNFKQKLFFFFQWSDLKKILLQSVKLGKFGQIFEKIVQCIIWAFLMDYCKQYKSGCQSE